MGTPHRAAALRYQHVLSDRDKAIAAGLDRLLQAADALADEPISGIGTQMARPEGRKTA